jgi:phage repressor protein C with HTH and peptisase S24 domain
MLTRMKALSRRLLKLVFGLTGLTRVEIEGNSMAPTYQTGEQIWVRLVKEAPTAAQLHHLRGQVILVERDEYPGIYLLKRLEKVHGDLIWIEGDNKDATVAPLQHDSRKFGWLTRETVRGVALSKR